MSGSTEEKRVGSKPEQAQKERDSGSSFVPPEMVFFLKRGETETKVTYAVYLVDKESYVGDQHIDKETLRRDGFLTNEPVIAKAVESAAAEEKMSSVRRAREDIRIHPERWALSREWGRTKRQIRELYESYGIKDPSTIATLLGAGQASIEKYFRTMGLERVKEEGSTRVGNAKGNATWEKIKHHVEESLQDRVVLDAAGIAEEIGTISASTVKYHIRRRQGEITKMCESLGIPLENGVGDAGLVRKKNRIGMEREKKNAEMLARINAFIARSITNAAEMKRLTKSEEGKDIAYTDFVYHMKKNGISRNKRGPQAVSKKTDGDGAAQTRPVRTAPPALDSARRDQAAQPQKSAPSLISSFEFNDYREKTVPVSIVAGLATLKKELISAAEKRALDVVIEELRAINASHTELFSKESHGELTLEAMKPIRSRLVGDDSFRVTYGRHPVTPLLDALKGFRNDGASGRLYAEVSKQEPRIKIVLDALGARMRSEGYY
ncbi:MAG: hypothetical protein M1286_04010 [Candidatus Marsarchaeota archaeon]|nr:hypothetical protein [Candidatus Marsarchaeota archaeon]